MDRDRNLLFGVFAVQLGKVSAIQLMEAAGAWAIEPSMAIPERLVAAGALSEGARELVQRLVNEAIAAHGGDGEKTLASFGGEAQVHQVYRGSIVLSPDGQVSIPPTAATPSLRRPESGAAGDVGSVKGVFETPGRYTGAMEHARGGMGRVLLVHDDFLGRDIALKELLPHLGELDASTGVMEGGTTTASEHPSPVRFSAHILARFLQEARITGQLEHPSIVPVYELGHRKDGSLYYTMKLVRGRSLSKAIGECQSLEARLRFLPHFVDLCQAIAYAHSRRVIHRDIKPSNVMVGEFGETVVLDWGLAKKRDREDVHQAALAETLHAMNLGEEVAAAQTAHGQILGTPVYMPPEQAQGDLEHVDEQSDVYSLGVVLYEILTGKIPFDGKSTRDVLNKVIAGESAPVSAYEKHAPPELVAIAAKAMATEKSGRYANATVLAEEVQRFQSGALVQAHRYNFADYTRFVWRRYKPLIATGAAALIALAVVTAGYTYRLAESRNREATERKFAEAAREEAIAAKEQESVALERAEATISELERVAYVSSIRLAENHMNRHETAMARQRLLETPAELRNWEWGNLYLALDGSKSTIAGTANGVNSASWSPDGLRIVTASYNNVNRVWNAETGAVLRTLTGHTEFVFNASWSPDGLRIVTASKDHTAKVWDAETGEELRTLTGHTEFVFNASWSPDGLRIVTASGDKTAKVWDAETGAELQTLVGHTELVTSASWSPDSFRIVTSSRDNTARVWDARTGEELLTLDGHADWVNSASWSSDGLRIVTASEDDTAIVWNSETGEVQRTLVGHTKGVNSASWNSDGLRIVTASGDKTAKVWNAKTGGELRTLAGHIESIRSAFWSPDGLGIVTISDDNTAKIWDDETETESRKHFVHAEGVGSASWSPDGLRIVTACYDSTAKVWDAETGVELQTLAGQTGRILDASWSPDGLWIVTASGDAVAKVWDAETGAELLTLTGHESSVYSSVWSPDGLRIVTTSSDATAKVWDAETGTELLTLSGHESTIYSSVWSPDGQRIVTASRDETAKVWNSETGAELLTLSGHSSWVNSVFWSPDGYRIVTASSDYTAKVWDAETGGELRTLTGHSEGVLDASWSPDGLRIVTSSYDKTAKVWDAETGVELRSLTGHTDWVHSASWSLDGFRIVTSSSDKSVKLWDSSPWKLEAWQSEEMVTLALRMAPRIRQIQIDPSSADGLSATITLLAELTQGGNGAGVRELAGRGILVEEPAALPVADGLHFNAGDLIVRVGGRPVHTLGEATAIVQEVIDRYRVDSSIGDSLLIDIVNEYDHQALVLDFVPVVQQDLLVSKNQALQLSRVVSILIEINVDSTSASGRDPSADRELYLKEMAVPLNLDGNDRLISLEGMPIMGYPSLLDAFKTVQAGVEAGTLSGFELVVERENPLQQIRAHFIIDGT